LNIAVLNYTSSHKIEFVSQNMIDRVYI